MRVEFFSDRVSPESVMTVSKTAASISASTFNFYGTAATNVAIAGLGVVTSIVAARLLGPTGRGELAAILNWPAFFTSLGAFGVMNAAGYYCGRYPSQVGRTFGSAWVFLLLISIPVMVGGYWLMPWMMRAQSASTVEASRIMLLLVLVQLVGGLPYWVLQGLGKFNIWNAMRLQMPFVWLIVLAVAAYVSPYSAAFVAFGYLAGMVIHNLVWNFVMFHNVAVRFQADPGRLRELLQYGLPSVLGSVPNQLNQRLDQLLIMAMLPAKMLGFYVVAVVWSDAFHPLMSAVAQIIFPRLASVHDRHLQAEILQRSLRVCVTAACVLTIILFAFTPFGLTLIFGSTFAPSVPVALVLVFAGGISSLKLVAGEALRGMGLPRHSMFSEFVGFGVGVPLLLVLLPRYQLTGVAFASLGGCLSALVASLILISRWTECPLCSFILPRRQDIRYVWSQLPEFKRWKALLLEMVK